VKFFLQIYIYSHFKPQLKGYLVGGYLYPTHLLENIKCYYTCTRWANKLIYMYTQGYIKNSILTQHWSKPWVFLKVAETFPMKGWKNLYFLHWGGMNFIAIHFFLHMFNKKLYNKKSIYSTIYTYKTKL
jgi:hypothetical protein